MNTAVSPNFIPIAEEILQKSYKIVYYELNPICPICGQPLNKNGLQKFILNKNKIVYKQKYSCKCCKYYKTTSLETLIGKYCNYTLEIKDLTQAQRDQTLMLGLKTLQQTNNLTMDEVVTIWNRNGWMF